MRLVSESVVTVKETGYGGRFESDAQVVVEYADGKRQRVPCHGKYPMVGERWKLARYDSSKFNYSRYVLEGKQP